MINFKDLYLPGNGSTNLLFDSSTVSYVVTGICNFSIKTVMNLYMHEILILTMTINAVK